MLMQPTEFFRPCGKAAGLTLDFFFFFFLAPSASSGASPSPPSPASASIPSCEEETHRNVERFTGESRLLCKSRQTLRYKHAIECKWRGTQHVLGRGAGKMHAKREPFCLIKYHTASSSTTFFFFFFFLSPKFSSASSTACKRKTMTDLFNQHWPNNPQASHVCRASKVWSL